MGKLTQGSQRRAREGERVAGWEFCGISQFGPTVVSGISSDCICAIRLGLDDGDQSQLTVIGVYLPCSEKGMDTYQDHLVELKRVISDSSMLGAVSILGNLNANLDQLGGIRGVNVHGVLLNDMLHRCHLNTISLGSVASPWYTYISDNKQTKVDYIITDKEATSRLSHCETRQMEVLNTSDHLPLVAEMIYTQVPQEAPT